MPLAIKDEIRAASADRKASWRKDLVLVAVIFSAFYFLFLGARPLNNPDEGRYAEIPREMIASGDFITPRLNGVKYFEKPPLVYWLTAGTIAIAGLDEFSVRFWMAFFAVGGAIITYTAGRWWFDRVTGWWSAIALGTCILYYGLSRMALLDLAMAVWITLALVTFRGALRHPAARPRRRLFWTFYASMGAAIMTKGLIGFLLPCGVILPWLFVFCRWRDLRPFYPLTGAALLLAITLPWHWLAARANPDFLHFYFIHEHFQRFTSNIHDRRQPWWFFGAVIAGGFFPWIVFAGQSLAPRSESARLSWRTQDDVGYLLLWIGVITLFFSVSQSKLIPYVLPVFPALGLLVGKIPGRRLAAKDRAGISRRGFGLCRPDRHSRSRGHRRRAAATRANAHARLLAIRFGLWPAGGRSGRGYRGGASGRAGRFDQHVDHDGGPADRVESFGGLI